MRAWERHRPVPSQRRWPADPSAGSQVESFQCSFSFLPALGAAAGRSDRTGPRSARRALNGYTCALAAVISFQMSERLHKLLARHGLGSRREIEKWMLAGRVLLNNRP